jgi:ERCC4-type nuclease
MLTEAAERIQVVVDDRERPSRVAAELEKLGGITIKFEQLAVGTTASTEQY